MCIFFFVNFQNELEEVTEKLSEMVARPYLRTPRSVIVQTTALARRKRHEFARAVAKGLVPVSYTHLKTVLLNKRWNYIMAEYSLRVVATFRL